jgi:hypothetical protein
MGIASLTPLKQSKGEVNVEKRAKRACGQVGAGRKCGQIAEVWRSQGCYHNALALLDAALVEDQFVATTRPHLGVTVMTIHKAKERNSTRSLSLKAFIRDFCRDAETERRGTAFGSIQPPRSGNSRAARCANHGPESRSLSAASSVDVFINVVTTEVSPDAAARRRRTAKRRERARSWQGPVLPTTEGRCVAVETRAESARYLPAGAASPTCLMPSRMRHCRMDRSSSDSFGLAKAFRAPFT